MGDFLIQSVQDSGNNPITVFPTFDFRDPKIALRTTHRTVGGKEKTYRWHERFRFQVPLQFVNSADANRINGWWDTADTVAFTLNSSIQAHTVICKIANTEWPLASRNRPYRDQYTGVLFLEAVNANSYQPQPFVLDDAVMGLMDQTYNALV